MEDPGVIFLTMKDLYRRIEESKEESETQVRLAYLEIYNETIRDLLSEVPTPPGQGLQLREDQGNKISVVGITEHAPESPEHVLAMIQEGNQRRTMSPTEANAVSSRSHAVLQINVTQRPKVGGVAEVTTSASLNIIDLAGSERASATSNNGARMKEGANINKSLLALGNCINALCAPGIKRHIPYRNSKLTRLLKFSLGGNCKTVMIVCVSPSSGHYEETHNTLKYANQAKNIRTKITQNRINVDRHVGQYVEQIAKLTEKVAQLEAELGSGSEAEKRKRSNAEARLKTLESELRRGLDGIKPSLQQVARHEASIQASKIRLSRYKERANEIAMKLREWSSQASTGEAEPAEYTSERCHLQNLSSADEASLQQHQQGFQKTEVAVSLYAARVKATANDGDLDTQAKEKMRYLIDTLLAQMEAERQRQKFQALVEEFEGELLLSSAWLTAGNRSTVNLKDAAGELEYKAAHPGEDGALPQELKDLASQLRTEADRNDREIFEKYAGAKTNANATNKFASRKLEGTGARRARASLSSSGSGRPAELAGSKRRLSALTRRHSVKPGPALPAAGPSRRRISNAQATPRKAALRRTSLAAGSRAPPAKVASPAPRKLRFADEVKTNDGNGKAEMVPPPTRAPVLPRRSTTPELPPPEEWEDEDSRRPRPRPKRDSLFTANNARVAKPSSANNRMLGPVAEGAPQEEDGEVSEDELTMEDLQPPGAKKSPVAPAKRVGFAAPTAASQARAQRSTDGYSSGVDENTSMTDERGKFKPRDSIIGKRLPQSRGNVRHNPYNRAGRQASGERRTSMSPSDTSFPGRPLSGERRTSLAPNSAPPISARRGSGDRRTSLALKPESATKGVPFPGAAGGRAGLGSRPPSTSMWARTDLNMAGLANGRSSPLPPAGANTSLPSVGTTKVLGPPGHTAARQRNNSNLSGRATPCGTRDGMGSNGPLNNQTRVSGAPR